MLIFATERIRLLVEKDLIVKEWYNFYLTRISRFVLSPISCQAPSTKTLILPQRSLWSTLHSNLTETEIVKYCLDTGIPNGDTIPWKFTMFNTTGKHWGHIMWLFVLKDKYNKACSVYVKHSSINVNLIWTFIRRVRAGRAKSTWVDGVRKGSLYGCIDPA